MKNKLLLASVAILLAGCSDESFVNDIEDTSTVVPQTTRVIHFDKVSTVNEILVKFKDEYSSTVESAVARTLGSRGMSRSGIEHFDNFLSHSKAVSFERVFPVTKFEKRTRVSGLHLWYKVSFESSLSTSSLKQRLLEIPELATIEFIAPTHLIGGVNKETELLTDDQSSSKSLPFDDPLLDGQWHYNNLGPTKTLPQAKPHADINLFKAWERTKGDPSVVVAVIDGYVQYNHPDLNNNMWVNLAELNGKPGVDDDNNGYVDDIHGYSFVEHKFDGKPDGHGTHVAGTIAAVNNNGKGVAGIAGGSGKGDGARIMACGALGDKGGDIETSALSLKYATDNGAVIAQNSWGYSDPVDWEEQDYFSIEREALQYFIDNAGKDEKGNVVGPMNGGVVIFAAGNDGDVYGSLPWWPAAHPDFIAVSSIGCDYNPAYYTCYGSWTDITAPGGDQVFTPREGGVLSTFVDPASSKPAYAYMQGTSMACPHVSGIAALVISYAKENNYVLTNTQLKDILLSSGRNIDSFFSGRKSAPAYEDYPAFDLNMADYKGLMGNGLIDASMALDRVDQLIGKPSNHVAPKAVDEVSVSSEGPESITLNWNVTADYNNQPLQSYSIYFSTEKIQVVDGKVVQCKYIEGPVMASVGKDAKIGDKMETVINGLKPATTYNLAVVGYDQWRSAATPSLFTGKTMDVPAAYPVEDLKTTDVSVNSFKVEWKETSDYYNRPFSIYHVYYSDNKDIDNAKTKIVKRSTGKVGNMMSVDIKDLKSGVLYYVKVVAYDEDDRISQPAYIQCKTLSNRIPEITPEFDGQVNLQYWETKSFKLKVVDPDYDSWTASLMENKPGWSLKADKQHITLTFAGPVDFNGTDKLRVKVVDEKGGQATYELTYHVVGNVAPVLKESIADLYIDGENGSQSIKLNEYFSDANNEPLTFEASSSNDNIKVVVTDGTLNIESVKSGLSEVTVKALDKQSKAVQTSFKVMARKSSAAMDLYPNPVKDVMYVRFGKDVSGPIKVKVLGFNGSPIFETEAQVSPFAPAKIDMKDVKPGNLQIQVECQGKTYKGNVVKL